MQAFRLITLPMITPIIFYNLVIVLIGLFNYFLVPFVLNNGSGATRTGRPTSMPSTSSGSGFRLFDMGYAATMAWGLFVFAVAVTGLLFWSARYWVHYEYSEG